MEKNRIIKALIAFSAAVLLVGCAKETATEFSRRVPGDEIVFGASGAWYNGFQTRTEYSGKDENNRDVSATSEYERLDWVKDYDQIRILCEAADNGPMKDYNIAGTPSIVAQKSLASIENSDKNGLKWGRTGDHYFYAMYPVPGMKSNYDFGADRTVSSSNVSMTTTTASGSAPTARITGVVPAEQHVVKVGNEYKANMNYAYLYAATLVKEADSPITVELSFNPLVTMFEFTLKRVADDPIDENLTKIELIADGGKLSGTFTADLSIDASGNAQKTIAPTGTTGNKITINLPTETGATVPGVKLTDTPLKVNILTLPLQHTKLTLKLYFGANGAITRSLDLKDSSLKTTANPDGWVTANACKKLYFSNLAVPATLGWDYTLDVTGGLLAPFPKSGGNLGYSVTSYKSRQPELTVKAPAEWTTEYSYDGVTWVTDKPAWLQNFTGSGAGSISATNYTAHAPVNDNVARWEGTRTPVATTQAAARDLSCYDIYGDYTGGTEGRAPYNTANCYVISAPGWYRIPCVYGNGYKNGVANTNAYTGPSSGANLMTGGFLNHGHAKITNPWIKNNNVSSSSSTKININGAQLLWQDVSGLITNVVYSSDYIYFKVDENKIFEGNAVIAAKAGNTIVWSWHIWVYDNPKMKMLTKKVYSHPTNNRSVVYPNEMLPMNLGFCDGIYGGVRSRYVWVKFIQVGSGKEKIIAVSQLGDSFNCTYYQWGRKDPMIPALIRDTDSPEEKTLYNINGAVITKPADSNTPTTIGNAIQNPVQFFRANDPSHYPNQDNWCSTRYDNLWNRNVTSQASGYGPDQAVVKTIYDPCPPGFKLPNRNAFSGFTKTGGNFSGSDFAFSKISAFLPETVRALKGYNFYLNPQRPEDGTIFFHLTGSKHPFGGQTYGVTEFGDITTATPGQTSANGVAVIYFTLSDDHIAPVTDQRRAYGFPARPVKE